MNYYCRSWVVLLLFLFIVPTGVGSATDRAGEEFQKALALENQKNYSGALSLYQVLAEVDEGSRYSGESLFRMGVIYDEKLQEPVLALKYYNAYLKKYRGRNSRRAEKRIQYLSKYEGVDSAVYQAYIRILSVNDRDRKALQIEMMERFIRENKDYPLLDEALMWLGNKRMGRIRRVESDGDLQRVTEAMGLFQRIVAGYPSSEKRIIALKRLGDGHRAKGELKQARALYRQVCQEGGEYGKKLVGKYMLVTNLNLYRLRGMYVAVCLILMSAVVLYRAIPLKELGRSGVMKGGLHLLLFLPFAALPVGLAFMLTDATKDNHTGQEPRLLLSLMLVTMVVVFFNGLLMETGGKIKISLPVYIPALFVFHLSATYCLFYHYGLLPYIERLVL